MRRSCEWWWGPVAVAAAAWGAAGCDEGGFLCGGTDGMCGWTSQDIARVEALGGMPATAPDDSSNAYATSPDAAALGKQLYYDTRFSGPSNWLDGLGRVMPFGRTAVGTSAGVACVSCHDPGHGGADPSSAPGDVSIGAGWTYNNGLTTYNAQYYTLHLWNGRADSLWAQAFSDNENALTTNGNRLRTAWLIHDLYKDAYEAVFTAYPLPMSGSVPTVQATVDASGQCVLAAGVCPAGCRSVTATTGTTGCWPRFPLQGKPGKKPGCQSGDPAEPFGDAFDCMDPDDQKAVTRVLVNFGKAIAAYEQTLTLPPAPFDQWVADLQAGHASSSTAISGAAKAGALLFVGKAGCSDCHSTPLLSDNKFHNVGIGQMGMGVPTVADCPAGAACDCAPVSTEHPNGPKNCLPFGARDGIQKLQASAVRRDSVWSDDPTYSPSASYVIATLDTIPIGAYRTPSLRNCTLTAPYMHDGSISTLKDVVWHYSQGISDQATPGAPAAAFKPLYLTDEEQAQLVAFLESLESPTPPAATMTPPTLP